MKIVVIGGTGHIGGLVVAHLKNAGHEALAASPSTGVDALTGEGLADALTGADAVVDVTNAPSFDGAVVVDFFGRSTTNLLAAEDEAGVRHHIALSIVGVDRIPLSGGYYDGKIRQEELIAQGSVPYTIVRATQFNEFIPTIVDGSQQDDGVHLSHTLFQPVAASEVADLIAEVAVGAPREVVEIAGPRREPLDELVAAHLRGVGDDRVIVRDDEIGFFGAQPADDRLVPIREDAIIGRTDLLSDD